MNHKQRALLKEFEYILNPRLLIEDVVNSAICSMELLPGAGSRIEYEHEYGPGWKEKMAGEEPETSPDYSSEYWHNTLSRGEGAFVDKQAPVKEVEHIAKYAPGNTLQIAVFDQAKFAGGGTNTGSGEPAWMWLQKADESNIDISIDKEGSIETHHEELGYIPLGSKPITFIISWLRRILSPYGAELDRTSIKHPDFNIKKKKYAKGFDIKDIIFFDIPKEFPAGEGESQKSAFDRIIKSAQKDAWFDIVGDDTFDKYGKWWIWAKTEEFLAVDQEIKAAIDKEKGIDAKQLNRAELKKDLSSTKRTRTDSFGDLNTKAAYEKWDRAVTAVSSAISRSGLVQDDRKTSPYYISMALQRYFASKDPVTFDVFDPENMNEAQAKFLFDYKALESAVEEIMDNPSALKLESIYKDIDFLLEQADMMYEEEAEEIDGVIFNALAGNEMSGDEIKKALPPSEKQNVDNSLKRMEKFGFVNKSGGRYASNAESGFKDKFKKNASV